MIGTDLLRLIGHGLTAAGRVIGDRPAEGGLIPPYTPGTGAHRAVLSAGGPVDPVDQHAAEVAQQLGLGQSRWTQPLPEWELPAPVVSAQRIVQDAIREAESELHGWTLADQIAAEAEQILTALHRAGRLVEPGENDVTIIAALRRKVRELGRGYGRASATIGDLRGQLALVRSRLHDAQQREITARQALDRRADPSRSTIAAALGLGPHTTTGAIVVAIRGLREAAESVVEVDADQVSLPVAAAVDAREEIERLRTELGRAGATSEWVWDPWAELPTPDEFDEVIADRARKGITYAFAPAAVRPLLAEIQLLRRGDYTRIRAERETSQGVARRVIDGHQRLRQALRHLVADLEKAASSSDGGLTDGLREGADRIRELLEEGGRPAGEAKGEPHARGPVSIPWTAADREGLAKALCRSEGAHPSWDALAGTGERQSYLAQARVLLDDGWRHLDAIMHAGFGPAAPVDHSPAATRPDRCKCGYPGKLHMVHRQDEPCYSTDEKYPTLRDLPTDFTASREDVVEAVPHEYDCEIEPKGCSAPGCDVAGESQ